MKKAWASLGCQLRFAWCRWRARLTRPRRIGAGRGGRLVRWAGARFVARSLQRARVFASRPVELCQSGRPSTGHRHVRRVFVGAPLVYGRLLLTASGCSWLRYRGRWKTGSRYWWSRYLRLHQTATTDNLQPADRACAVGLRRLVLCALPAKAGACKGQARSLRCDAKSSWQWEPRDRVPRLKPPEKIRLKALEVSMRKSSFVAAAVAGVSVLRAWVAS